MRTQAEWNVIAQTLSAPWIPKAESLSLSSFAALFVNVTASTDHGAAGSSVQRCTMRLRSSLVGCSG